MHATSPSAPCASINAAMIKAADGDTIWVAAGRYYGTGNEVAVVYRDVALEGGWNAGFTWQEGSSVLDGQQARRGMTVKSTANAVSGSSSRTAVPMTGAGCATTAVWCCRRARCATTWPPGGRRLGRNPESGGHAHPVEQLGHRQPGRFGGWHRQPGHLYIDNCTLSGNRAWHGGSAIYGCAGNVAISSSTITNNFVEDFGAVHTYWDFTGSVALRNSLLAGNTDPIAPARRSPRPATT